MTDSGSRREQPAAGPVRIGLVGYGVGGRFFHAPLIDGAHGCELSAVVARSPRRRAEAAFDHPGILIVDTLSDLAGRVDAVVISTPLDTHLELTGEAVRMGLPVVCDKPFAPDAASAQRAVEAAERAGVLLTVYQNRRWDSDFLTVRKVVDTGVLGDVLTVESRMEQFPPEDGFPTTGGGILLDLGTHAVDQLLLLAGPVRSVYADVHELEQHGGLDDQCFLVLRHDTGTSSRLTCSVALQGAPGARFRIIGEDATFAVAGDDGQTAPLLAGRTPRREGAAWGRVPEHGWGAVHANGTVTPVVAEAGCWPEFYSAFAASVRDSAPPPVDPWQAVATLRVLDAARRSAATGEVVHL